MAKNEMVRMAANEEENETQLQNSRLEVELEAAWAWENYSISTSHLHHQICISLVMTLCSILNVISASPYTVLLLDFRHETMLAEAAYKQSDTYCAYYVVYSISY